MNIIIVNLIKVDIINEIFQRILINEMLINRDTQISKNTLNHKVINVNKINCILKDHRNNENDIGFNIEHRIYKRYNNKLISFEQILRSDIIFFDKYKINVNLY